MAESACCIISPTTGFLPRYFAFVLTLNPAITRQTGPRKLPTRKVRRPKRDLRPSPRLSNVVPGRPSLYSVPWDDSVSSAVYRSSFDLTLRARGDGEARRFIPLLVSGVRLIGHDM